MPRSAAPGVPEEPQAPTAPTEPAGPGPLPIELALPIVRMLEDALRRPAKSPSDGDAQRSQPLLGSL